MQSLRSLVRVNPTTLSLQGWVRDTKSLMFKAMINYCLLNYYILQELNHIRVAAIFMTVVMIVAILSSIAIVRRILMATSVLKASANFRGLVYLMTNY